MKSNQSGFTIIELAMVLVIIGLIVGFGASLVGPLTIRAKRIETTKAVDAGFQSIIGYGAAHQGVLPTDATFPGILRKRNDAWNRPIEYIYDAALADGNIHTGDLCTRRATRLSVRQCPDAACSAPVIVNNVAFVLLSGGDNFNNQTAVTRGINTNTIVSVYPNGVGDVDNSNVDFNRPEPYDDIVSWATLDELRSQVGCRTPQLTILNNELPPGSRSSPYSATIYMEGGVPFSTGGDYLWCVQTPTGAVPAGLTFRNHTDSTDIGFTTDGASLAESSTAWTPSDHIQIEGTPTTAGSFLLTVWGRDNSNPAMDPACNSGTSLDNCIRRAFVITINP